MQEQVQRNLASGAVPEVVYGKMEPALVAYHPAIDERLAVECRSEPSTLNLDPDQLIDADDQARRCCSMASTSG